MASRRELYQAEDAAWEELLDVVESFTQGQLEEPGYFEEGWSAKDLLAHIGCWQAEAGRVLVQIQMGTFDPGGVDVEALNQQFYESNKDLPLSVVRAECWAARTRMITELNELPEVSKEAEEWFVESGAVHYQEHLPRLRAWLDKVRSRPG
jgi:hypothetical protein